MIVSGIVNAVAGQKVQDATAVFCEQLTTQTADVLDVHAQQVEQRDPLRVHVLLVVRGVVEGIVRDGGRHAGCDDRGTVGCHTFMIGMRRAADGMLWDGLSAVTTGEERTNSRLSSSPVPHESALDVVGCT